jgi:hypothetical protein
MAVRHVSETVELAGVIDPADTTVAPGNLAVAMQRASFKMGVPAADRTTVHPAAGLLWHINGVSCASAGGVAAAIANTANINLRTELSLSIGIGASMKINAPTVF